MPDPSARRCRLRSLVSAFTDGLDRIRKEGEARGERVGGKARGKARGRARVFARASKVLTSKGERRRGARRRRVADRIPVKRASSNGQHGALPRPGRREPRVSNLRCRIVQRHIPPRTTYQPLSSYLTRASWHSHARPHRQSRQRECLASATIRTRRFQSDRVRPKRRGEGDTSRRLPTLESPVNPRRNHKRPRHGPEKRNLRDCLLSLLCTVSLLRLLLWWWGRTEVLLTHQVVDLHGKRRGPTATRPAIALEP